MFGIQTIITPVPCRSEALQVGDYILSINGTPTEHLVHTEVNALLQNAGNVVNLEISFETPPGTVRLVVAKS